MEFDGLRFDRTIITMASFDNYGLVGKGVTVKPSELKFNDETIDPGLGLFADRSFAKNEIITEYGGQPIPPDEMDERMDEDESEMIVSFQTSEWSIDGRMEPLKEGRPGGQFANDGRSKVMNNSVYFETTLAVNIPLYRKRWKAKKREEMRIWIIAVKPIHIGDEILVDYEEGFWATHFPDMDKPLF